MAIFILGQAGRSELTNMEFILDAPWKACRICGSVCQTEQDRKAYELHKTCHLLGNPFTHTLCELAESRGRQLREKWLKRHNRQVHTNAELKAFANSGLEVTAVAAAKLASYGIIHMSGTPNSLDPDEELALLEAPRAPVNDAESW